MATAAPKKHGAPVDHHVAEHHRSHRVGWLRAAVLGANDGIVSVASLLIGVATAGGSHAALVTAGLAGLVAGAVVAVTLDARQSAGRYGGAVADLGRDRPAPRTAPVV